MYGGGQQALVVGLKLPLGGLLAPPYRGCRGCADVLLQQLAVLRMHAAADLE